MNKHNAKDYLPLMQALSEGKTIQIDVSGSNSWSDVNNTDFAFSPNYYRIKPEPKLRPWTPEEVPVGIYITAGSIIYSVVAYNTINNGIRIIEDSRIRELSVLQLFNDWKYSSDNGKTWHPCGVICE